MYINLKIGTMPARNVWVCRKRKPPVVGSRIQVKRHKIAWVKPEKVVIDNIEDGANGKLYFGYLE